MKKIVLLLIAAVFCTLGANAQTKRLNPYVTVTTYSLPGQTPFVETALAFESKSVVYKEFSPGKFKATLEIVTVFRKGEETTFSKVALDSPVVTDTANLDGAFIDQQRFALPNGEYEMQLSVTDKGSDKSPVSITFTVEVDYPKDAPAVSDILLFDNYEKAVTPSTCTKSGFNFVPRVFPFSVPASKRILCAISAASVSVRTRIMIVLSPAMVPRISGHSTVSSTSPATLAEPLRVLATTMFPA